MYLKSLLELNCLWKLHIKEDIQIFHSYKNAVALYSFNCLFLLYSFLCQASLEKSKEYSGKTWILSYSNSI